MIILKIAETEAGGDNSESNSWKGLSSEELKQHIKLGNKNCIKLGLCFN